MDRGEQIWAWLRGGTEPQNDGDALYDETAEALLIMGRLAARRLEPTRLLEFRRLIEADMRSDRFGDHPVFREWLRRVDLGPDSLAEVLEEGTERGRYMRSMAPLRAFVSREERSEILRSVARAHGLSARDSREAELDRTE